MSHTDAHQPITDAELDELWTDSIAIRGGNQDENRWHKFIKPRYRRERADSLHMKAQNRQKRHADKIKVKKLTRDLGLADDTVFADHRHDHLTLPRG